MDFSFASPHLSWDTLIDESGIRWIGPFCYCGSWFLLLLAQLSLPASASTKLKDLLVAGCIQYSDLAHVAPLGMEAGKIFSVLAAL